MTCVTDERRAAAAVAQIPTRRAAAAVAQTLLRDQLEGGVSHTKSIVATDSSSHTLTNGMTDRMAKSSRSCVGTINSLAPSPSAPPEAAQW